MEKSQQSLALIRSEVRKAIRAVAQATGRPIADVAPEVRKAWKTESRKVWEANNSQTQRRPGRPKLPVADLRPSSLRARYYREKYDKEIQGMLEIPEYRQAYKELAEEGVLITAKRLDARMDKMVREGRLEEDNQ